MATLCYNMWTQPSNAVELFMWWTRTIDNKIQSKGPKMGLELLQNATEKLKQKVETYYANWKIPLTQWQPNKWTAWKQITPASGNVLF